MPPEIFYYLVSAAVLMSATALLIQAIAGYKIYKIVAGLRDKIDPLVPQAQTAIQSATKLIDEGRVQINDVTRKSKEILELTAAQIGHFDDAREEVSARLRVQAERVELILDDSLNRVHDVVGSVHRGIMKPVHEVSGVMAGIRAAVSTLRQANRPSVADATNDDGMFI